MTLRSTRTLAVVGRIWAGAFLIALVGTIAAVMVAGLPLSRVVDVVLTAQAALLIVVEVHYAIRLLLDMVRRRAGGPALLAMIASLFMAAPIGLALYALSIGLHQPLAGASAVYDGARQVIGDVLQGPAQLGSAAIVAITRGGGYANYVAQIKSVLEAVYYAIGILISIPALKGALGGGGRGDQRTAPLSF